MYKQLTFIAPNIQDIEARVDKIHALADMTRKGLFARHAELKMMYEELRNEFEDIKSALCRMNHNEK